MIPWNMEITTSHGHSVALSGQLVPHVPPRVLPHLSYYLPFWIILASVFSCLSSLFNIHKYSLRQLQGLLSLFRPWLPLIQLVFTDYGLWVRRLAYDSWKTKWRTHNSLSSGSSWYSRRNSTHVQLVIPHKQSCKSTGIKTISSWIRQIQV